MTEKRSHWATSPPLDALIGRSGELARVLHELRLSRLVSLYGAGGSGKTRVALAAVQSTRESGVDAWFVDASSLSHAELLLPTIVRELPLDAPGSSDALVAISAFLASRDGLIALDNLEQIHGAGEVVRQLVETCPRVRVISTSRVPLGVQGEVALQIPPLELPASDDPEAVASSPAGALFYSRSRSAGGKVSTEREQSGDVAEVLRRLDGLPLAIELAAARTRIFSPRELVQRLDEIGLASIEGRDRGDIHRSLSAILDWTLGFLEKDERRSLEALSVAAGFDLELAATLAAGAPLDAVETLVGLGLVQPSASTGGRSRFRVLEPIRAEVARQTAPQDRARYRDRHASAMLDLAERNAEGLESGDLSTRERIEVELDNFRIALEHLTASDPTAALGLWHRLHSLWESNSRLREGKERLYAAVSVAPPETQELARALARHAMNAEILGESGREVAVRALAVARSVGDDLVQLEALLVLAVTALNEGDTQLAASLEAELNTVTPIDLPAHRARLDELRYMLAAARHGPQSDEALQPLIAAAASARTGGRSLQEIALTGNLASLYLHRGDSAKAAEAAARSAELAKGRRNRLLPWSLGWLAMSLAVDGDANGALEAFAELAHETATLGSTLQIFDSLLVALPVAVVCVQSLLAARIWGAALGMLERGDADLPRDDRVLAERSLARVRRMAREIDVELALRDGRGADPAELLTSVPDLLADPDRKNRQSNSGALRHGELTRREVEVLRLVGQGQTDAGIAESLVISPKTASVHVANIKSKLGVASRVEVALRARDMGIE